MFISLSNMNCFCMNYSCSITSCVCHYIAIIGWILISGSTYSGSCSTLSTNGSKLPLCSADGPALGLFLMIIFPIIVVIFVVIACAVSKKTKLHFISHPPAMIYPPIVLTGSQPPIYNPGLPMYGASNYAPQYENNTPQYPPQYPPPQYPPSQYPPGNALPGVYQPELNPYPQYNQPYPPKGS